MNAINDLRTFWKDVSRIGGILLATALPSTIGAQDAVGQAGTEPETADIINSVTYDLGDHLVEFQEVTDLTLPGPPTPREVPQPQQLTAAQQAQLAAWQAEQPAARFQVVTGTVYRASTHPPRTLLRVFTDGGQEPAVIWSSIDWSLFPSGQVVLADGTHLSLLVMLSTLDEDQVRSDFAAEGRTYIPPVIPPFPNTSAGYQVISGVLNPTGKQNLDSLHALHDNSYNQLLEAADLRRQQAEEAKRAEAERKSQPPSDVVIRYRVMTPEELERISHKIKKPSPATK